MILQRTTPRSGWQPAPGQTFRDTVDCPTGYDDCMECDVQGHRSHQVEVTVSPEDAPAPTEPDDDEDGPERTYRQELELLFVNAQHAAPQLNGYRAEVLHEGAAELDRMADLGEAAVRDAFPGLTAAGACELLRAGAKVLRDMAAVGPR